MTTRLHRLRRLLDNEHLDGVIVTSPANRFYLSGFLSDDDAGQTTAALLVDRQDAILMTGATNADWARGAVRDVSVREWSRPWPPVVAKHIRDAGWRRVGFEDSTLTVAAYQALRGELGSAAALIPLGRQVDRLRRTKDEREVTQLAKVIALTDGAFADAVADLAPGITERQFAWRIDRALRDRGADGSAFGTIVASGPNASRPHHAPSDRILGTGEPIIIDMGATLDGYNGDLTRTEWLGEATDQLRKVVRMVAAAQNAAWNAVGASVKAKDVHAAAVSVVEAAGFGKHYLHGTGHGLGIVVHEAPSCGELSEDVLQIGDLITIEPGVYIPGWGGVRIEDVGMIEASGFRRLTGARQQLVER